MIIRVPHLPPFRLERLCLVAAVVALATYRNVTSIFSEKLTLNDEQIPETMSSSIAGLISNHSRDNSGGASDRQGHLDELSTFSRETTPNLDADVGTEYNNSKDEADVLSDTNRWNNAILATTRLLYRDSPPAVQQFWLSQPPPKVYIYDTIPATFSDVQVISECVDRTFLGENISDVWVTRKQNCRWRPTICDDHTVARKFKQEMFVYYRYNYNMDVTILDKFHRYPHQTKNPSEADLFVVPYPHKSHCLCHKNFRHYSAKCAVAFEDIHSNVMQNLHLWKVPATSIPYSQERHVFFYGADWLQELRSFRAATANSITLSLGPVLPCDKTLEKPCGHVTVPYVATDRDFQPPMWSEPASVWTPSVDRPYLLAASLGSPKGLQLRREFLQNWSSWIGEAINGKPHAIVDMGAERVGTKPASQQFMQLYRNSTVCLILPGDGCAQKRFFDTLLNGCIPMVPLFPSNDKDSPFSFYRANRCSTRITYPFAKGTFFRDPDAGFDILDMVVTFNGTCGLSCLRSALIDLVSNSSMLQEKQNRLRDYTTVIRFGLTHDSNDYPDAFSSLMVRLRHHAWHILYKVPDFSPKNASSVW